MQRSEVPEVLNEVFSRSQWTLESPSVKEPLSFSHFADLFNFVSEQNELWKPFQGQKQTNRICHHWASLQNDLENSLRVSTKSDNYLQHLREARSRATHIGWPSVFYNSPLAQKIMSWPDGLTESRRIAFLYGAIAGFEKPYQFNIDNPEAFLGFIEGVAFREPDVFGAYLKTSHDNLGLNYETRTKETEKLRAQFTSLEKSLQDTFLNNQSEIETWRKDKISALDDDLKAIKDRFTNLENLYTEKLKLEAPAQYWKARASRLRNYGFAWLGASIVFFVLGGCILWQNFIAPATFAEPIQMAIDTTVTVAAKEKDTLTNYFASVKNVRALVGFSILVSLFVYLLRMLVRLTISSFHLALDAAEREQLTYVYLALIEKGQKSGQQIIQETDRSFVMQALFSRAETGLLAGDSSPTMPGADVAALLKGGKS